MEAVLPDVVHAEIVSEGRRGGYADAAALTAAVALIPVTTTKGRGSPIDTRVLGIAQEVGVLIANDLALGRRARSIGVSWIRTADLIVLAVRSGWMSSADGAEGLRALEESGRITRELAEAYREQLQ